MYADLLNHEQVGFYNILLCNFVTINNIINMNTIFLFDIYTMLKQLSAMR